MLTGYMSKAVHLRFRRYVNMILISMYIRTQNKIYGECVKETTINPTQMHKIQDPFAINYLVFQSLVFLNWHHCIIVNINIVTNCKKKKTK